MTTGYVDTSFLLSLLFEDEHYEESVDCWNSLDTLCSSVLLEIESRINLYRHYGDLRKDRSWQREREKQLTLLLNNINRRTVDDEIIREIRNYDKLKEARSLDGIHLATANILNKLTDEKVLLCSYDKRMIDIGGQIGLKLI